MKNIKCPALGNKKNSCLRYLVFSIFWFSLTILSYYFFDKPIAYYFAEFSNTPLFTVGQFITEFGRSNYYIAAFLFVFLFYRFIVERPLFSNRALFLLASVIISGLACLFLKVILSRARPSELFSDHLFGFFFFKTNASFWSFPSGHTITISAVMLSLCLLFPYRWVIFPAITALIAVSLSRLVVTAHYLSDVLAGIYLAGMIVVWLYHYFEIRGYLSLHSPKPLPQD